MGNNESQEKQEAPVGVPPVQAEHSLRTVVKLNTFNSILFTQEDVQEYLRPHASGTAHPFAGKLVVWDENKNTFQVIDISKVSPDFFLNKVSLGEVEGTVGDYLNHYTQLHPVRDYTVQVENDNSQISSFVASTKRDGNYFYYVAYIVPGKDILHTSTYANRNVAGFKHSGDIGSLLHTITIGPPTPNEITFVLGAVGFRKVYFTCVNLTVKVPLRQFSTQLPVVFIVNHETRTIYMVPCPLDKATMGDATLSGLVVGKKKGNSIRYCVLPAPLTVDDINTGECSKAVSQAVSVAINQAETIWAYRASKVEEEATSAAATVTTTVTPTKRESTTSTKGARILQFVEHGIDLKPFMIPGDLFVGFGAGLSFSRQFSHIPEPSCVNLPCIFGPCKGVAALSLGNLPQGDVPNSVEAWHDILNNSRVAIIHATENWLDTVVTSCTYLANAIFVIHPALVPAHKEINKNRTLLENALNVVGTNVLAMAGPNSIVLIEILGKLYFYRGVRWAGLLDKVPAFGDDVTSWYTRDLPTWCVNNSVPLPWPVVTTKPSEGGNLCCWKSEMMLPAKVLEELVAMDLNAIYAFEDEILDFLTQISVLMSPEQVSR